MERLFDLAEHQAATRPNGVMLAAKINGKWETISCQEVVKESQEFASALIALGLKNKILEPEVQEKIAIVSNNRPEWIVADLAVQQTGAILTPIYPTISPEEFAFILNQSEVKILIVANQELYDRFQPAFKDIPTLQYIYSFDEVKEAKSWKSIKGTEASEKERIDLRKKITGKSLATIIYTSGTTGKPKGVMLSHENIVNNIKDCTPILQPLINIDDRSLSFLPLNHIFEKMITYLCMHAGVNIYYAESMDTIGDNLREVHPAIFTCVPRVLEKVYEKIMSKGSELTGIKKSLFFWSVKLGKQYDTRQKGSAWYRMQLKIANKLVFSKWRDALGGQVKAVVSGSAPLADYLIRLFTSAGVPVIEGYGLTETSPVLTVNGINESDRIIGTVGEVIPNVEVKIASDGEILCRGKNIMVGYYKNQEETDKVLDKDGWFHTGDIGEFVEGSYLKITDRKKEMFKTSGGKYVAPQPIENKFKESRFIAQMMVIGPNRKFVTAVVVPEFENVIKYLNKKGIQAPKDNADLIKMPEVKALFDEIMERYNPHLSHIEQIKRFALLPEEWTIDNGILTPKLSLRRKVVNQRYKDVIDQMYEG